MKTKLKFFLIALTALATTMVMPISAYADDACISGGNTHGSNGQVLIGVEQTGQKCDDSQVSKSIQAVINVISFLAGVLAIVFLLIAGFRFVTSAGDANKAAAARRVLIYAMVGIAVVAASQAIALIAIHTSSIPTSKSGGG